MLISKNFLTREASYKPSYLISLRFFGAGTASSRLFWTSLPNLDAARAAVTLIRDRLRAVEAFAEAVALWDKLSSA